LERDRTADQLIALLGFNENSNCTKLANARLENAHTAVGLSYKGAEHCIVSSWGTVTNPISDIFIAVVKRFEK
jgi:hypothetical protein